MTDKIQFGLFGGDKTLKIKKRLIEIKELEACHQGPLNLSKIL
jgi:hypothetical protein